MSGKQTDYDYVRHMGRTVLYERKPEHSVLHVYIGENDTIVRVIRLNNQRVEVPILNAMYGQSGLAGTHRIMFYKYDEGRDRWILINPSTGQFGAVLCMEMKYFRSHGIILVGKVKSPKDIMYKWVKANENSYPLWNEFLDKGKLFKEYQRCLGNRLISQSKLTSRLLFVDLEEICRVNGIDQKDAGDGSAWMKSGATTRIGQSVDTYHALGYRILDHPVFRTVKGNITTNLKMFNLCCKYYGKDPLSVDFVIPMVDIKVASADVEAGSIYVIEREYLRFVSYRDADLQSKSRITVVGAVTLCQYASVVVEMLKRHSKVTGDAKLVCDTLIGDLSSYVKMVGTGSGESVMAEVSAIAFPIWTKGKGWEMPLLEDYINYLLSRSVSFIQKHIRKCKLRNGWNRRAGWSLDIEKANVDNHTGAYIIKMLHQAVIAPQCVVVGRTLGDYDGDDITGVEIASGIHLCWRNPLNGPNSMFVGLEKGKATVQDVPEWAMPLVRAHKKLPIIPEPPKGESIDSDTFTGKVNDYQNSLLNAWANSPLLGQATNQLFKNRVFQVTNGIHVSHDQLAQDNADIEFRVVKAIKSTLDMVGGLDAMAFMSKFKGCNLEVDANCSVSDKSAMSMVRSISASIDKHNKLKLADVFPQLELDAVSEAVWQCCSKSNSQGDRAFLYNLVENAKAVRLRNKELVNSLPIVYATEPFADLDVDRVVKPNWEHYKEMAKICRYTLANKQRYGLPTVRLETNRISNIVHAIEVFNNISSAKVDSKRLNKEVKEQLTRLISNAVAHITNNNLTGLARVEMMVKHGRTLLYTCLGMYDQRGEFESGMTKLVRGYDGVVDARGIKQRGRDLCCGLSNIDDQDLRSFAFGAVAMFMRWYLKEKLPSALHRFTAMLYIGQRVFVIKAGSRPRSPRLWNIMYSALPVDNTDVKTLHDVSGIWTSAVSHMNGISAVNGAAKDMDALFASALSNQYQHEGGYNTGNIDELMMDAGDFDAFS